MSCVLCESCDRLIDSDYDCECFLPDDSVLCGSCRDARGGCDYCGEILDADGACYHEACRKEAHREQESENRHNAP